MLDINPEELLNQLKGLDTKISNYDSHISELLVLSKQIEASTDWVDETVKPSFISYLNSYIEIYKTISKSLKSYSKLLRAKVNNFKENETKFS